MECSACSNAILFYVTEIHSGPVPCHYIIASACRYMELDRIEYHPYILVLDFNQSFVPLSFALKRFYFCNL